MRVVEFHYDVGERVGVHSQTDERLPSEDFYGSVRRILLTEKGVEYNVEIDDLDTHGDLWWFTEDELFPTNMV